MEECMGGDKKGNADDMRRKRQGVRSHASTNV